MIRTIKLQDQMDCNYICRCVQEAVLDYQKQNGDLSDCFIVLDIKKPYDDYNLIPKLENKNILT